MLLRSFLLPILILFYIQISFSLNIDPEKKRQLIDLRIEISKEDKSSITYQIKTTLFINIVEQIRNDLIQSGANTSQADSLIKTLLDEIKLPSKNANTEENERNLEFLLPEKWVVKRAFSRHKSWVTKALFTPDGKKVITSDNDGVIYIWSTEKENDWYALRTGIRFIKELILSKDGKYLIGRSNHGEVYLWNLNNNAKRIHLQNNEDRLYSNFALSENGKQLVGLDTDSNNVVVWDTSNGNILNTFETEQVKRSINTSVTISPDNRLIAIGTQLNRLYIYESTNFKLFKKLIHPRISYTSGLKFTPDNKFIIGTTNYGQVYSYDFKSSMLKFLFSNSLSKYFDFDISSDSKKLVLGSSSSKVILYDLENENEISRISHSDWIKSITFSPDDKHVFTGSFDQSSFVINSETGKREQLLKEHKDWIQDIAISPDGKYFVSVSNDKKAILWKKAKPSLNFK